LNPCKSSHQELWKGTIKQFSQIKILDPSCKHFYRQYVSDYPCRHASTQMEVVVLEFSGQWEHAP